MKRIILYLSIVCILSGCYTAPQISNLKDFKECKIQSVQVFYSGIYTSFIAYCDGEFKNGVVPMKINETMLQQLIDDLEK